MTLFDPDAGGRLRAILNVIASACGASFAVAGVSGETWAQVVLIALTALVTVVQILTHGSDFGTAAG